MAAILGLIEPQIAYKRRRLKSSQGVCESLKISSDRSAEVVSQSDRSNDAFLHIHSTGGVTGLTSTLLQQQLKRSANYSLWKTALSLLFSIKLLPDKIEIEAVQDVFGLKPSPVLQLQSHKTVSIRVW